MKQFSINSKLGKKVTCPWFSQLILFVLVLFSIGQANAQAIVSYTFAQSSGTYTQAGLGASLTTSAGCYDDGIFSGGSSLSLPFTFTYHGATYSTVSVSPNGTAN